MNNISNLFDSFRQQTKDDLPAAILTLAAVLAGDKADESSLTVKQAAAKLAVAPDTIYSLIESGKLKHQRIGAGRGTIRIRACELRRIA